MTSILPSRTSLDQLHRILVDAPKDKAAPMCGERQPEPQIGLPAAGLAPVEQFVGLAKIGVALRPRIGHPGEASRACGCRINKFLFWLRIEPVDAVEDLIEQIRHGSGFPAVRSRKAMRRANSLPTNLTSRWIGLPSLPVSCCASIAWTVSKRVRWAGPLPLAARATRLRSTAWIAGRVRILSPSRTVTIR